MNEEAHQQPQIFLHPGAEIGLGVHEVDAAEVRLSLQDDIALHGFADRAGSFDVGVRKPYGDAAGYIEVGARRNGAAGEAPPFVYGGVVDEEMELHVAAAETNGLRYSGANARFQSEYGRLTDQMNIHAEHIDGLGDFAGNTVSRLSTDWLLAFQHSPQLTVALHLRDQIEHWTGELSAAAGMENSHEYSAQLLAQLGSATAVLGPENLALEYALRVEGVPGVFAATAQRIGEETRAGILYSSELGYEKPLALPTFYGEIDTHGAQHFMDHANNAWTDGMAQLRQQADQAEEIADDVPPEEGSEPEEDEVEGDASENEEPEEPPEDDEETIEDGPEEEPPDEEDEPEEEAPNADAEWAQLEQQHLGTLDLPYATGTAQLPLGASLPPAIAKKVQDGQMFLSASPRGGNIFRTDAGRPTIDSAGRIILHGRTFGYGTQPQVTVGLHDRANDRDIRTLITLAVRVQPSTPENPEHAAARQWLENMYANRQWPRLQHAFHIDDSKMIELPVSFPPEVWSALKSGELSISGGDSPYHLGVTVISPGFNAESGTLRALVTPRDSKPRESSFSLFIGGPLLDRRFVLALEASGATG